MSEIAAAEGWMATQLRASSVLMSEIEDVYSSTVPRGTVGNVLTWEFQGAEDDEMFNNIRIAVRITYLVCVVGIDTLKDLGPADTAMDAALHRQQGIYNGYRIASCRRTAPFARAETVEETEWRYLGGYYELYVQPPGV